MKRVLMVALIVLMAAPALARNGAISLYIGTPPSFDCDQTVAPFATQIITMYWIKGDGPDMGRAAEFRVMKTSAQILIQNPTWDARFINVIGTLAGGISVSAQDCVGVGETYVRLGTFPVMNLGDPDSAWVKVYPDPGALDGPRICISLCDLQQTLYDVEGGWFLVNPGVVTCSYAVEARSWGAIKSLYR